MDNQKDPLLNHEDELKAENNLLKLKLTLEHGMQMEETSTLSPDIENQWLKSVYAFEQQFKDAKRIRIYDYIGRPSFKKWNTLTPEQTREELQRIQCLMEAHTVQLDCICEYDDAIIYRFITEELFKHEMDDMRIPGMTSHFTYEEFHPNHDYDLRRQSNDFVHAIFTRSWKEEFDGIWLAGKVSFSGKDYDRAAISVVITTFQEAHVSLRLEKFDISEVTTDIGLARADVRATLCVSGKMKQGGDICYDGVCSLRFVREDDYWNICDFDIPGFSRKD